MILCAAYAHQLFGPHVVQNPLSVLAVMATLHNCKKQLRGIVLWKKLVNEKVVDIFKNVSCASIIWNQDCKYTVTVYFTTLSYGQLFLKTLQQQPDKML